MKKMFLGVLALVSTILIPGVVSASDITSSLDVRNALGSVVTFEKSYDSENDVNNVHVVLTVNETVLNTVLAQKPGVGGNLGVFYVGVVPTTFRGMPEHKQVNMYYTTGTDFSTVKSDLATRIASKGIDTSGDPTTWIYGVAAQYYKNSIWNTASGSGTGSISIGDNLVSSLGLTSIDELVYGENYRLFMYENYDWYIEYQEVGNETNTEYVKVSYEIKFPVTAKMEDGTAVYYPTLQGALSSESKNIVINDDLVISENITIPEDIKVTIEEDVTVDLAAYVKLINKGKLINDGEINLQEKSVIENTGNIENNGSIMGDKAYYTVTGSSEFTIPNSLVQEGELVKVTVADKAGYKVKSVKGVYGNNQEVAITEQNGAYSFTMPQGNVTLSVEYEAVTNTNDSAVKDEENPKTFDGILGYGILGLVSLMGLLGTGIYLKRKHIKSL